MTSPSDSLPEDEETRLALAGLIGLMQLVLSRDDLPPDLADAMRANHRYKAALKALEPRQVSPRLWPNNSSLAVHW